MPGGSSSGSAVAVALGIADIGIGTDTSGSVRVPAALNGLIGFRPSLSRYDKHGVFPLAQSLDTIGTIARDLETIILTDRVLSRSTDSVPAGTITEVIDITDSMDILWDDEVRRNHDALREALQQAGLKVRSNQLQSVRRAKELMQEFGTLVAVEARRLHDPLMTSDAAALTDPFILRRLSQAPVLSDADYATYLTRRAEARRMAQFEIGQALVIHPTTPLAAPSIAEATASPEAFAEINARMLSATMIGSFLDLPGLTLPSGATGDGRPTSTLLSAAPDADAELLAQAETLTNRIAGSELIQITNPKGQIMAKDILVAYGVDVDAVAGWLGSYGGEDSPDDISRGLFAGEVGSPRLLKLFEKYDMKTSWFIPGHSMETFPDEMKAVADAGHEIGIHGYSHENPIAMTREQETAILDKSIELATQLSGKRPTGYVAPWWEFSNVTNELLLERGIKYDHSLMHNDFHPYRVRVGDSWTKIDYSQHPETWMKPLERGEETDLIEIPANWYLDDLPPMMFIKKAPNSHGFVSPRHLEQMWKDQFDYVYRENDYAVFTMTIHPDVSGRPQVLLMHERIIEYINSHEGVRWVTFDEIADDYDRRFPRG